MGLQKGQRGYAFRWLTPISSMVGSLFLFINAIVCTLIASSVSFVLMADDLIYYLGYIFSTVFGSIMLAQDIVNMLNFYVAVIWIGAILHLALAIVGFVLNKKFSYIFATVVGGLTALTYLIKAIIYLVVYSKLNSILKGVDLLTGNLFSTSNEIRPILLLGIYMLVIFAIGVCVCLFGALAIPKCDYEKSVGERHIAGENLTYVGFENDPSNPYSRYHNNDVKGPVDPYAPKPEIVEKPEPQPYVPQGPIGSITGVKGMYRDAKFTISDNEQIVIGRDPRVAQIVIGEGAQNVSRQHCSISYSSADNSYRINDTSKNGTFSSANKARLPHGVSTKVPAGTEIYLGDRSNTFRLG